MKSALLQISLLLSLLSQSFGSTALAVESVRTPEAGVPVAGVAVSETERYGRNVDEAALIAKRKSLTTMVYLEKYKKNTPEEPEILVKLIEMLYGAAGIEFRIAHGRVMQKNVTQVDLAGYKVFLAQLIEHSSRLISQYPKNPGVPRALYLRAKAYKENGRKEAAVADFKYLVDHYPRSDEASLANLSLCDLVIELKDYKAAIQYLTRLAANPASPFFPFAIDRLAWVYYYMGDVGTAIAKVKLELDYYAKLPQGSRAQAIEKEKALLNATLFYVTALETKKPGFDIGGAIPFIESLQPGKDLGKTIVHFAVLLRSRSFDVELEEVKKSALNGELAPNDAIEILMITFENQVNKRRYPQMKETVDQLFAKVAENAADAEHERQTQKARHLLSSALTNVQSTFMDHKNGPEAPALAQILFSLYDLMQRNLGSDRFARIKIRNNMAEISFLLKKYEDATANYRWIVDNGSLRDPKERALVEEARLKAIASRYEYLRQKQVFPKELAAASLKNSSKIVLDPKVEEWLDWIDHYPEASKVVGSIDTFRFEANRLVYSFGRTEDAVKRLSAFVKSNPASPYSIPSATLIIDTYIASADWEKLHDTASSYAKVKEWESKPFHGRMGELAGDASSKLIEIAYREKDFKGASKRIEAFLREYPAHKRYNDVLALAANTALATGDKRAALQHFTKLIGDKTLKSEMLGTAQLTRASIEEEDYAFEAAAKDYREYLKGPLKPGEHSEEQLTQIRRKTLFMSWFTGTPALLEASLASPGICVANFEPECDSFRAILSLSAPQVGTDLALMKRALERSRSTNTLSRTIWATVALKYPRQLSSGDRLALMALVAGELEKQDPIMVYALLPHLAVSIPENLKISRQSVKDSAHIKMDKAAIARRVQLIDEMEGAAGKLRSLPYARLRVASLNEVANLYADFSSEMDALPSPPGLAGEDLAAYRKVVTDVRSPFDKKRDETRAKAYEMASETGVDTETFMQVAQKFFIENPEFAKVAKKDWAPVSTEPLTVAILKKVDVRNRWTSEAQKGGKRVDMIRSGLVEALESKNFPKIIYLVQEAKQKRVFSEPILQVARGISLSLVGANAEALSELQAAKKGLGRDEKIGLLIPLISTYLGVCSKDKTRTLIEEFMQLTGGAREAGLSESYLKMINNAANWSGAAEGTESVRLPAEEARS